MVRDTQNAFFFGGLPNFATRRKRICMATKCKTIKLTGFLVCKPADEEEPQWETTWIVTCDCHGVHRMVIIFAKEMPSSCPC